MNEPIIDRLREAAGDLWKQAITHPSFGPEHNQRLEFLGNGVLNMALADLLYQQFKDREGQLSLMCNYLRSDEVLSEVGRSVDLGAYIQHVPNKDGRLVDSIVAGSMEAIIGAAYRRAGYDAVKKLVEELLLTDDLLERARKRDPISELKELVEANDWKLTFRPFDGLIGGRRVFYHSIVLNGQAAVGMGSSKKKAETQASRITLSIIGR